MVVASDDAEAGCRVGRQAKEAKEDGGAGASHEMEGGVSQMDPKGRLAYRKKYPIISSHGTYRMKLMSIDTDKIVMATVENQKISAVARQADQCGKTVIFRKNRPKNMLIDVECGECLDLAEDEKIDVVARRIMKRHKAAFLALAI